MTTAIQHYLDSIGFTVDTTQQYGGDTPKWAQGMNTYECILKRNGERMFAIPFYQGKAHTEPPKREDVLHALLADKATVDYLGVTKDFEDWANGLGYNVDSISDLKLFNLITEQTNKLELHFTEQELSILSELMEGM
jgi:hypothetical protein